MGVDASTVQISINVVDTNSAAAVGAVTQNVEKLGAAGAAAGQKIQAGMAGTRHGFTSSLDQVRLLRDEFGIRLPRAMEHVIARSAVLSKTLGTLSTGLVGLGAIEFGGAAILDLAEHAKKLYDNYISLNKAAADYTAELVKARDEDFGNTRSIEDTRARIQQATGALLDFRQAALETRGSLFAEIARGLSQGGLMMGVAAGAANLGISHSFASTAVDRQKQADRLSPKMAEQQHDENVRQIEYNHALDGTLRGLQKINAERAKAHELNAESRRFANEEDAAHGNPVASDAGASEERLKNQAADRQAQTSTYTLERSQAEELRHLRESALEASLRGEAVYHAQEAAAIEDLKNKDIDSVAARRAVHDRFHAEELKRMDAEKRETDALGRQAAMAGLNGVPRLQAEGHARVAALDPNLDPAQRAKREQFIHEETNAQILASEQDFTDRINQLSDENVSHQISGYQRIRVEGEKQVAELRRAFEKLYGKDANAPEYKQHVGELNQGIGVIRSGEGRDTVELQRRAAEETRQIEMEAHARSMSDEKQQTVAIESEYEQRVEKYQEQLRQQEISYEDYNRRVLAAGEQRDGQMVQNSKEARDKMAGQFTSFFSSLDHPTEALAEVGRKAAGQAAAAMIQRAQNHFGGAGAPTPTGDSVMASVFGRIAGHPRGAPGVAAAPGASQLASIKSLSLATAEIHVQSASLSLGSGAGSTSSSGSASSFRSMGSTMATVPGSGFSSSGFGGSGSTGIFGGGFGGGGFGGSFGAGGSTGGGEFSSGGTVGGAGDSGFTGGSARGIPSGAAPGPGRGIGGVLGLGTQAMSLGQGAMGIFGRGKGSGGALAETQSSNLSGTLNADGTFTNSGTNGGMLGGGGVAGNLGGAAGGAMGMVGAYESNGGAGGALGGAMSGMQLGMALGGPMGAAVGAGAGAIIGAIGFGGREKARVYDLKTVRPRLLNDMDQYQQGQMDYLSTYSDMQSLYRDANMTTNAMGPAAKSYYQGVIKPEILAGIAKLSTEQRAGRSDYTTAVAQYAVGADRVPHDGLAYVHADERIFPSDQNERITRAIEGGASSTRMAASSSNGFGGDIHIHAIDAKSGAQWLMDNKHVLRKSINASYAENSGGADA